MEDPRLVRRLDSCRDLGADLEGLLERERAAGEPRRERFPLDVLKSEVAAPAALLHTIDARDVGMIERGEGLRLALEAGEPVRVRGDVVGQRLDRDPAVEPGVASEVDDPHAAPRDLALDAVGTDLLRRARAGGGGAHDAPSRTRCARVSWGSSLRSCTCQDVWNLLGSLWCQEQESAKCLRVIRGSRIAFQKQNRDQISPTKELASQGGAPMSIDREVRQVERPLVGARAAFLVVGLRQLPRPVHFVADHQDLLIQRKRGPPLQSQPGVLNQGRGSPLPMSLKVSSLIRSRIAGSRTSIPGLPLAGRMLMSAVYSMHSSCPLPG